MRDSTSNALLSAGAVAAVLLPAYALWRKRNSHELPLPPSPTSYPLIGNLLSMPSRDEHLGFMQIGKELNSDIFSLTVLGTIMIVLNSAEDATNLLERRSSIYSDRVCPPMLADPALMDWGNIPSLLGYNDRWRMSRRLMHPWLHKQAAASFQPSQQRQARLLIKRMLQVSGRTENSEDMGAEIYRAMGSTIMSSVYGYKVESADDTFLREFKVAADRVGEAALPSNFLVNVFPALVNVPDWFPGTNWKRTAREWRKQKDEIMDNAYDWAKARIGKSLEGPSMIESMLSQTQKLRMNSEEADDQVKHVAGVLFGGGTDTTANSVLVFLEAMLLFPHVLKKAQEEIDRVIGSDRLPDMNDRADLPYVERVILEVLRWRPMLPGGVPHVCYQDDVYKGYKIPKGALVFANFWAITRNAEVYKDPEAFNPDRFLDPSVSPAPIFGHGRRSCPGMHYAESSLFIFITSILATFNISMAKDENGKDIEPVVESSNALIYHPTPFKLKLAPRSPTHEKLIYAGVGLDAE